MSTLMDMRFVEFRSLRVRKINRRTTALLHADESCKAVPLSILLQSNGRKRFERLRSDLFLYRYIYFIIPFQKKKRKYGLQVQQLLLLQPENRSHHLCSYWRREFQKTRINYGVWVDFLVRGCRRVDLRGFAKSGTRRRFPGTKRSWQKLGDGPQRCQFNESDFTSLRSYQGM